MANQPTLAKAWIGLIPTLDGSTKQIEKELGDTDVDKPGKKVGSRFAGAIGVGLAAASLLIAKGLSSAVAEASTLNESLNAIDVTYGDNAAAVQDLGEKAANTLGLSNSAFNGLAVQFSAFTKTIAGDGGDVVGTLESITGRASDFASVMDLEVADAARIFQSGLAGETEPLRDFGIDLSAASVEAYALANGIGDGTGKLTEAEKVQARYGSLMAQTSNTQGDFAKTSDEFAGSQKKLSANMTNLSATIGTAFLPVLAKLSGAIIPIIDYLGTHKGVLVAIGATIGVLLVGAFVAWTASIWAANAALLANPITWVVLAVIALVAAVIWAYKNVSWFKTGIDAIGAAFVWLWQKVLVPVGDYFVFVWQHRLVPAVNGMVAGVTWLKDQIVSRFNLIKDGISAAITYVTDNFQKMLDFFKAAPGKIGGFFSRIGDFITRPFKNAFNGIARMWNNSVGKLSFTIPDIIGVPNRGETFSFPRVPMLADGGVVTRPTLVMAGEGRGPEAIVPLDKWGEFGGGVGSGLGRGDLLAFAQEIVDAFRSDAKGIADGRIDNLSRQIRLAKLAGEGMVTA